MNRLKMKKGVLLAEVKEDIIEYQGRLLETDSRQPSRDKNVEDLSNLSVFLLIRLVYFFDRGAGWSFTYQVPTEVRR